MIAHPARTSGARGEAGETLVELVVTTIVLGIVAVGLLAALWTSNVVSASSRRSSRAAVEATTRAEAFLDAQAVPYVSCAQPQQYETAAFVAAHPLPAGYTAAALQVDYLVSAAPAPVAPASVATATFTSARGQCVSGGDQGVQRLTVVVTSSGPSGRRIAQTVVVLKRNDTCSAKATALPGYSGVTRC